MDHVSAPRFFLGANAKTGFSSLYDGFVSPVAGDFLWVIKGGPGCGKSSFMKRLGAAAQDAGLHVQYILCSGDPDSLDGVYFPEKRVAYVDGTAPHVIEADYPGAASRYLDMSVFLDVAALRPHLPELMELSRRYKALYAAAYGQLAAAAALLPKNQPASLEAAESDALARRIDALAARELRPLKKQASCTHRFLSARSCQGHILLTDTLPVYCERLYTLDNALGLGHSALARLASAAQTRGYDAIVCHDPLEPEKLEALLLPELKTGFFSAEDPDIAFPVPYRRLRLDALAARILAPEERTMLRQKRRESRALLCAATQTLAEAKALHDTLEAVYHPHVDFSGADALAQAHIRRLLSA